MLNCAVLIIGSFRQLAVGGSNLEYPGLQIADARRPTSMAGIEKVCLCVKHSRTVWSGVFLFEKIR